MKNSLAASIRAYAIEAAGIIRPLGIAEIRRAAGEGVRGQWNPSRIGETDAGFHHDHEIGLPQDRETECVALHPKARAVVQNCRVR